jgi:DNA repair photolyase
MISVREISVKSLLTKTQVPAADYVINPYVGCPHKCIYCYADYIKRFTGHHEPWGEFIDIKRWNKPLNLKRLADKKVLFCSATDAYNPFERKYHITRSLIAQFVDTDISVEILTKSAFLVEDIDLFKRIKNITIGISLNTLDDAIRRKLEPCASNVAQRIETIQRLNDEGINTYIFLSPIFPGITDFREMVNTCKSFTRKFYFENLNLRGAYRPVVLNYIKEFHPKLVPLYHEIYVNKNIEYWKIMEQDIGEYCQQYGINWGSYFYHEKIRKK